MNFKNAKYKNGDSVTRPDVDTFDPKTNKYIPGDYQNGDVYLELLFIIAVNPSLPSLPLELF